MYRYPAKVEKVGFDPLLPDPVVQIATLTQIEGTVNLSFYRFLRISKGINHFGF